MNRTRSSIDQWRKRRRKKKKGKKKIKKNLEFSRIFANIREIRENSRKCANILKIIRGRDCMYYQNLIIIHECSKKLKMKNSKSFLLTHFILRSTTSCASNKSLQHLQHTCMWKTIKSFWDYMYTFCHNVGEHFYLQGFITSEYKININFWLKAS